jgi:hypothetical protein
MKNIYSLIFIVLVLTTCSNNSQTKSTKYFEGNIKYKIEYGLKTDKLTAEYMVKTFGKTADVYFKDGNIYETYDGGVIIEELYRIADNKNYVRYSGVSADTLKWVSCTLPGQEILNYEIKPKQQIILGVVCDEYISQYKNKTVTYYFNADTLQVNPDRYKQFTLTNKDINTARMKANYLKFKLDYRDFWVTFTATEINAQTVDSKMFDIKPGTILAKDESYQ